MKTEKFKLIKDGVEIGHKEWDGSNWRYFLGNEGYTFNIPLHDSEIAF